MAHGKAVTLPSELKEVSVPAKLLAEYAGTYEVSPEFKIVMTVEGDRLMTQATGQPKFPLFAELETKFFLKVVDAQVEFIRGPNGGITHLILHQGGRDTKALRK